MTIREIAKEIGVPERRYRIALKRGILRLPPCGLTDNYMYTVRKMLSDDDGKTYWRRILALCDVMAECPHNSGIDRARWYIFHLESESA